MPRGKKNKVVVASSVVDTGVVKADKQEIEKVVNQLPQGLVAFSKDPKKFNDLERILPGGEYAGLRESLKANGVGTYRDTKISMDFGQDGRVVAMAAAVPRSPTRSEDYLFDSVPDFTTFGLYNYMDWNARRERILLYHQIENREGIINNAVKKTASLVAQDGNFKVRAVRQGKRPSARVVEDLNQLLLHWQENINSDDLNAIVTGSRGIKQVIRRGSRQAMVEGDLFMRQVWSKAKVPTMDNRVFKLPMIFQAMPSQDIYVPPEVWNTGLEVFYWRPIGTALQAILAPRDENVKRLVEKTVSPQVRDELARRGMVFLDPALLIHIKHGGIDTDVFGRSIIEPAMTDLAYSRSLKALDFVTIDSLVNRMLIIKIGDANEKSDYHNLAVAQQRVNTFRKLLTSDVGPNMVIVWAGHDVDKVDIGAHNELLDTTSRHEMARDGVKLALGVPDSILMGTIEGGGRGTGWLGFIALSTVAEELREEFGQVLTEMGRRIAVENNFDEVDLIWEFTKDLLADKEANAKIMLQAYDRGLLSIRSTVEELGKDFDAERGRIEDEDDLGDRDLFEPPLLPKGGPGGMQGTSPGSAPGRPKSSGNPNRIGPDRKTTDKPKGPAQE